MNALEKLQALEPLIDAVDRDDLFALANFLCDRICHPDSYLVFLGETSCGKSSIINGFIGEDLLPVRAYPSTATITEIELSSINSENKYLAIDKDANASKISREDFLELCEHPSQNLNRVRVTKYIKNGFLDGLRIFDTPGFGAIVEDHEEVLKEFLPNSDIVAYVVNYRTGIQIQPGIDDNDFVFLRILKELIRPDVEVILIINRCPEDANINDRRVLEIKEYAEDLLGFAPSLFLIGETPVLEGERHALPNGEKVWRRVESIISSEDRKEKLDAIFDNYVRELYLKCDTIIHNRYALAVLSDAEKNQLAESHRKCAWRIRKCITTMVNPTFDKLISSIPQKMEETKADISAKLLSAIEESKVVETEMVSFTQTHLLPYTIERSSKNIVLDYIESVLTDLNDKLDDYVQKEIINFSNEVTIRLNSHTELATMDIAEKLIQEYGKSALGKYFIQYGGAGGGNAGIANSASHLLKKVGDFFGKTFSLETHNALKHTLSKIGATSMKAIGSALSVVVEFLSALYKLASWKLKLEKSVSKGIDKWAEETTNGIKEDLIKLKDQNIETIMAIAANFEASSEEEVSQDAEKYLSQIHLSEVIGKIFI